MRIQKTSAFNSPDIDIKTERVERVFKSMRDYLTNLDSDVSRLFDLSHSNISFGPTVNLAPGNNLFGQWVTVADSGTANTEFSVTHTLKANGIRLVPGNYFVTRINKGGVVYDSGTTWTTTTVYLKCSAANATINIFLTR